MFLQAYILILTCKYRFYMNSIFNSSGLQKDKLAVSINLEIFHFTGQRFG
jgi:hypothetical protein